MWSQNCFCSFCYVDLIFACFYLTGQLKSILQKFQLAGVVLVVLNPHVFNLTGQLESKPPEFPTLAATDQSINFYWVPAVIRLLCFFLLLARFLFQSSFFSESRLCTWPFFSHFVTNLDRLAGQPIQIFLQSRFWIQIFYVFPRGVNPVGDNCMMTKASLWHGCWRNGGVLGLCWINDGHRPPLFLLSSSSFGVLVAFVPTGGIVAVWCHCCHCCHCCRCCHRCCCLRCRHCCRRPF